MMKINKRIINILVTVICIIAVTGSVVSASSEWSSVYTEDYSSVSDSVLLDKTTKNNSSFSVTTEDEKLVVKSDALCYYRVQDTDINSLNSKANAHGLSVQIYNTSWVCSRIEDAGDGVVYEAKNTNGILVEEKGGLNALGTVRIRTSTKVDRNNIMFNVDPSLFKSTDNNFVMKIRYYTPDGVDKLQLAFRDAYQANKDKTMTIYAEGESGEVDTWHTATVNVTGADFTKPVTTAVYNFRLTGIGAGEVYIHSVEIFKAEEDSSEEGVNSYYEEKISQAPIYGNSKLEYKLTIPSMIPCTEDCTEGEGCIDAIYNEGKNKMSVSMLDDEKIEFASLLYEIDGNSASIYAQTTIGGENDKVLIYDGDIIDRELTYSMALDMKEGVYRVGIYEDGEPLSLITDEAFSVFNKDEINLYCKAQYVRINHNSTSEALYSVFDDMAVSSQVNKDYEAAATDLDAISVPEIAVEDFDVPVTGDVNSSSISWLSDDPAIEIFGTRAIVTRGEADAIVTLTAMADCNGMVAEKAFTVTVKSLEGVYSAIVNCDAEFESDGTITASATLIHPGTSDSENVIFAVLSINSATGEICNRVQAKYDISNTYGEMLLGPLENIDAKGGDTIKCYVWDENNKAFANNVPVIRNFKAQSKVRGVGLSWEGYDDNDAVEAYEIYRNGTKIAEIAPEGNEMTYLDTVASGNNNSYAVIPVDTNRIKGEKAEDNGKYGKIKMDYYLVPYGEGEAEINANGNGISMMVKVSDTSAGYTIQNSKGRIIPAGKYIPLLVAADMPKNNIAIEFTYKANAGTKLQVLYNTDKGLSEYAGDSHTVTEKESGQWQIFTTRLTDANLEVVTGRMNNAHFALQALGGEVLLNKIEIMELSKYE